MEETSVDSFSMHGLPAHGLPARHGRQSSTSTTRRDFLTNSLAAATAIGSGLLIGQNLFADRLELAARIAETDDAHPLAPALELAKVSLTALDAVKDYKATFYKSELIGRNLVQSQMELKLRESPFSVYLKFVKPSAGREAIYVSGQNNNTLQVHETGFASLAGTLSLDPKGGTAMDGNRYPVMDIGMRNLLVKLVETWLAERTLEGLSVEVFPNASLGDLACKSVEVSHRIQHPNAKFQLTRMYFDKVTNLPIRFQAYNFPGKREKFAPLAEDYFYSNVKLNNSFEAIDFSVKNPQYAF